MRRVHSGSGVSVWCLYVCLVPHVIVADVLQSYLLRYAVLLEMIGYNVILNREKCLAHIKDTVFSVNACCNQFN